MRFQQRPVPAPTRYQLLPILRPPLSTTRQLFPLGVWAMKRNLVLTRVASADEFRPVYTRRRRGRPSSRRLPGEERKTTSIQPAVASSSKAVEEFPTAQIPRAPTSNSSNLSRLGSVAAIQVLATPSRKFRDHLHDLQLNKKNYSSANQLQSVAAASAGSTSRSADLQPSKPITLDSMAAINPTPRLPKLKVKPRFGGIIRSLFQSVPSRTYERIRTPPSNSSRQTGTNQIAPPAENVLGGLLRRADNNKEGLNETG
ncbi:hypothetical protein HUJ04_013127 [Dendroctonus ponderosae]|nr:hypothetical protein HUJ04_013127 [Dendroctonus ponderosae]